MEKIIKPEFYDRFQCTADQCPFTCCQGWDISVDTETEGRWNEEKERAGTLLKNTKYQRIGKKKECFLKMDSQNRCYHLDEKGLCSIVIQFGDEYLPKTCRVFPRRCNEFGGRQEYSLSCTCPAVVDLFYEIRDKLKLQSDGGILTEHYPKESSKENPKEYLMEYPQEYRIREVMISLMQNSNFPLRDRILLIFHMLLQLKNDPDMNVADTNDPDSSTKLLKLYLGGDYTQKLSMQWRELGIDFEDTYLETMELFLDISENYRKEKTYHDYLPDIYDFARRLDVLQAYRSWNDFLKEFDQYEQLLENVLAIKVFANCVSSDLEELLLSYQLIVTEYIVVRYSVFLRWLKGQNTSQLHETDFKSGISGNQPAPDNHSIDYRIIRDYITVFSRMIEYNEEGIREFWEESFDTAIWEFGYLLLLLS